LIEFDDLARRRHTWIVLRTSRRQSVGRHGFQFRALPVLGANAAQNRASSIGAIILRAIGILNVPGARFSAYSPPPPQEGRAKGITIASACVGLCSVVSSLAREFASREGCCWPKVAWGVTLRKRRRSDQRGCWRGPSPCDTANRGGQGWLRSRSK
jgi:hypothetical protein